MDKYIFDENNGLWYELQGDYYLPCLKLSNEDEEQQPIGIWGFGCPVDTSVEDRRTDRVGRRDQRHRRYLKNHRKAVYADLLTSGKLNGYLADIDREAEGMFERLVNQMAEVEDVNEKLKVDDMITWVGKMNGIRNRAAEIVNAELIFA